MQSNKKIEQLKAGCIKEFGFAYDSPEMKKFESFMRWLTNENALVYGIQLKTIKSIRGVYTDKRIESWEKIALIPKSLFIRKKTLEETKLGMKIAANEIYNSLDEIEAISIFLMIEMQNSESKWRPYLDMLPKDVDIFPVYYKSDEESLIKETPLYELLRTKREEPVAKYKELITAIPEFKDLDEATYCKYWWLTQSRVYAVRIDDEVEDVLIPFAGIFLHKNL